MAISPRDTYLAAVRELERLDLVATHIGASDEEKRQNMQKYEDLNKLYSRAYLSVPEREREEIKRVHAQVGALFLPTDKNVLNFFHKRTVHYLRVALENNYWRLAHECFMKMPFNKKREALELLCFTHGSPNNDTVEDGLHHVGYNPEYLLSRAPHLRNAPRIIDVLLSSN